MKLFGFSSTTLKLPEVFAGVAAVPLLYAAVRRIWDARAGIAAALAIAVLPVEVITSRSDTMDAVMMVLIVLALLFIARAIETGSQAWLLAGAAALGLAFNVKLLESLVALPGIAVLAYLGMPETHARRIARLALAGVVYVVVALSWLTATLIAPAHDRPYAIGSTNGSAWNAAFVFNGTDRLGGKSPEPGNTEYEASHHYPVATQSERDHIPIVPPSPTRLLARIGPLSGERLGLELLMALLLGVPALLWGLRTGNDPEAPPGGLPEPGPGTSETTEGSGPPLERAVPGVGEASAAPATREIPAVDEAVATPVTRKTSAVGAARVRTENPSRSETSDTRLRIRRAAATGLIVWMLTGMVLFSHMTRLHPRYVEGFTPVVAAMLGIGVAWASSLRGLARLAVLSVSLAIGTYYAERLLYGRPGTWWIALAGALGAIALAAAARLTRAPAGARAGLATAAVAALTLVAVLAVPIRSDVTAIETHVTDAGYVGALPSEEQRLVSSYLRAHQHGARYEVAAESSTQIGSLIVQDARPILILTTYSGRVFTSVAKLERLIAEGQVRYAFLNTLCSHQAASLNPACSAPARWIRAHSTDVSLQAGLPHRKVLYLLAGAKR